eukprot:m.316745 g.316745  ORF g.316745 m.316745 type:complete len:125 (-) comp23077_c1_seq3:1397-1771(-)
MAFHPKPTAKEAQLVRLDCGLSPQTDAALVYTAEGGDLSKLKPLSTVEGRLQVDAVVTCEQVLAVDGEVSLTGSAVARINGHLAGIQTLQEQTLAAIELQTQKLQKLLEAFQELPRLVAELAKI